MRDLAIAYGASRNAKQWSNKTTKFDDLKNALRVTVRTPETQEEYAKYSKSQRDQVKDHGSFVGGHLKGGRRRVQDVEYRSMLTLDGDAVTQDFIDTFDILCPYAACLYSTHSHRTDNLRVRVVIPLTRDVTPEEFQAVSRYVADMFGIDMFDECSYMPNQLMYNPSSPSNAPYLFIEVDGDWLNPDDILNAHPEWKDPTMLPTSSRESVAHVATKKKRADPLAQKGVAGAFNRAFYPISKAFDLLTDVYEATDREDRYHFIESDSMPGVMVYDDKFAFSHHAKDPAYMRLLSAFELVRIHRFPNVDDKQSFKDMADFALSFDEVKVLLADERMQQAEDDFAQLHDDSVDWRTKLHYEKKTGILENSVWNLQLILANDPDLSGFGYNQLANRVQITGEVPWKRPKDNSFWRDADTAQLKAFIDSKYLQFTTRNHDVAFMKVADDRAFHPIRDYFGTLPKWDGIPRVETLLIDYLGAADTEYVRTVTRKTFAAAVARVFEPGCKFDAVLILRGPQGAGKSSLFAKLAGKWFSDSLCLTDMKDKTGAEKLAGKWILELGELAGMKKADIETVKSFLSRQDDDYRPSYGRTNESHPRQCIIVGTTNAESGFLRDITGNRRFWPVEVTKNSPYHSWELTEYEIKQIWSESYEIYAAGEELFLSDEEIVKLAEKEQKAVMEQDERQGMVEEYLEMLLPDNWDDMDIYARRDYFRDRNDITRPVGKNKREYVSNIEIWVECFGNNPSDLKTSDSYVMAALMTNVSGWERSNQSRRLPFYGKQRVYFRAEVEQSVESASELVPGTT